MESREKVETRVCNIFSVLGVGCFETLLNSGCKKKRIAGMRNSMSRFLDEVMERRSWMYSCD